MIAITILMKFKKLSYNVCLKISVFDTIFDAFYRNCFSVWINEHFLRLRYGSIKKIALCLR